jgi:hypothetical protein
LNACLPLTFARLRCGWHVFWRWFIWGSLVDAWTGILRTNDKATHWPVELFSGKEIAKLRCRCGKLYWKDHGASDV